MALTWEQKLEALQCLGDVCLRMRKPGDWYVSASGREIGGDGCLVGEFGNGTTPEEAVEDEWMRYVTELPLGRYIVLGAFSDNRRHVRWNGFMWQDIPVK